MFTWRRGEAEGAVMGFVGEKDMFPNMAVLGAASLELSSAGGDDEHFAIGLGGSIDTTVPFIYLKERLKLVISYVCSSC